MTTTIQSRLQQIAQQQGFQILYACETGSRGWGFASPDSDYDIRFIYVYPHRQYLQLSEPPESFNLMETVDQELLDFNAWELRKLLRHARQSNATVYEWLQSPFIYSEEPGFRDQLWPLVTAHFNPRASIHHYLGICHNTIKNGVADGQIGIKKYFYVLRPVLAALWAAERRTVPPMAFQPLLTMIDGQDALLNAIHQLWAEKEKAPEGFKVPLVPEIESFVADTMDRCRDIAATLTDVKHDDDDLNQFFQTTIL